MRIGPFSLWTSEEDAKALGCTHHAMLYGLVPGFVAFEPDGPLWVSRSDIFALLEDALSFLAALIRRSQGEFPVFAFRVSGPIAGVAHDQA